MSALLGLWLPRVALDRAFPIRRRLDFATSSRLEVGDTAGWKPALRNAGSWGNPICRRRRVLPPAIQVVLFLALAAFWLPSNVQGQAGTAPRACVIMAIEGTVEVAKSGTTNWVPVQINQRLLGGDMVRTGPRSRATLMLSDRSVLRLDQLTTTIPEPAGEQGALQSLLRGAIYLFHRGKGGTQQFQTPVASGSIRGTEFHLAADADGRTVLTLFDGEVDVESGSTRLHLSTGEQAVMERGKAPVKTAVLNALNVIQWCLYYPGVLDLKDLEFTAEEQRTLGASLAEYQAGDLPRALGVCPLPYRPQSVRERLYLAAVLLSAGRVDEAEFLLSERPGPGGPLDSDGAERLERLANALRTMVAAVKAEPGARSLDVPAAKRMATEWLAISYHQQAFFRLTEALKAAHQAVALSPEFAFGWARVAELEFGFGRISAAGEAVEKALQLAPRNAQAAALKGFVFCARNRINEAQSLFEEAIRLDAALGNGWLGRGLCHIRRGEIESGRQDLLVAAALEPQRALLRSYLGKAFSLEGEWLLGRRELDLAKRLDPRDPTAWLYLALLDQQENRVNEGVRDLEKSKDLNDQRSLFRSRLLLDQDRAVRSANLAALYRDAGLEQFSLGEAGRAVAFDYGNYSAHLFLADSLNELRDPTRFNLRYETPWLNELLLAQLLAPVGGAGLSQNISQAEYSRLFEVNRLGLSSVTETRSDGQIRQLGSQFGVFGNTSYAFDVEYQHNGGVRPNNELSRLEWGMRIQQQLTWQDTVLLLTSFQDYSSGDNFQYYDPAKAFPNFHLTESQAPVLVAGYHREWRPGVHTLVLGGWLTGDQHLEADGLRQWVLITNAVTGVVGVRHPVLDLRYQTGFKAEIAEVCQIFQGERHTSILGGRFQTGDFTSDDFLDRTPSASYFNKPAANGHYLEGFERLSAYGYHHWKLHDDFMLIGGVAFDHLEYPENFRYPPLQAGQMERERVSPKAGLVWSPRAALTLRAAYAKSLGGVVFDESYRLEPSQLAGFNQSFRTLIPESAAGSVAGPDFETWGTAVDLKLHKNTYFALRGERLGSAVDRTVGVFDRPQFPFPKDIAIPAATREKLDYEEQSVIANIHQLLGSEWSVGSEYRYTRSELQTEMPEIPALLDNGAFQHQRSDLHELKFLLLFNHPRGFFARSESLWLWQNNRGYAPDRPGDAINQINLQFGYRLRQRKAECSVGVLNLAGSVYHLNPLNPYYELPRERVFFARLRLNF